MKLKNISITIFGIFFLLLVSACNNSETSEGTANGEEEVDENWPTEDLNINVHSGSGNLDTAIRQLASLLEEELGVNIIVENKPGGAQSVSQSSTQNEEADGYTFQTFTSSTSFGMAQNQIPFGPSDWQMVASIQQEPAAIAVRSESDLENVEDFVEAMQENPNEYVVGGYGSSGFMSFVYHQLMQEAGFESDWIPIDTTDEVASNLLGNHIDVAVMTPSTALSAVNSGDIKLLGIATEDRVDIYPDVPTFTEQGYDIVDVLWRGLGAKEGTPDEIVSQMHEAIMSVTESEEWMNFQEDNGQLNDDRTPEEMDEQLSNEVETRTEFLQENDLIE